MATRLTRKTVAQTWRTFLASHVRDLVAIDFFTVPTARLRILFVLIVLAHHRRRVVHFNVAEHPTAWTAQQIVDAFPDEAAPAYLLRDRDRVYAQPFRHRVKGYGCGLTTRFLLVAPTGRDRTCRIQLRDFIARRQVTLPP